MLLAAAPVESLEGLLLSIEGSFLNDSWLRVWAPPMLTLTKFLCWISGEFFGFLPEVDLF